jgi:phage FluMu protein Com
MYKCRKCGKTLTVADVGGVNPYYEISCPCGESPVVGSHNKEEVITTWNILNERSGE